MGAPIDLKAMESVEVRALFSEKLSGCPLCLNKSLNSSKLEALTKNFTFVRAVRFSVYFLEIQN